MFKKILVALLLVCLVMTSVVTVTAFANENENTATIDSGDSTEPTSGYMLYIYNADGSIGHTINGTKSISEFNLASALEDAYVFANNAWIFGGTAPFSYEIVFYQDIVINEQVVIPEDKTVTINLNGKAITSGYQTDSTSKHIYPLNVYGALTIKDTKGNGSITGRGLLVQSGSKLTIDGGSIYAIDSNGGSALYMYGGDVVINGGHVEQKAEGTYNFAIQAPAGSVTVNGGWIGGNHGAIAVTGATVVVNDGELVCTGNAGMTDNVMYVSDGSLVINGGTFTADGDIPSGGACLYHASGSAVIMGGSFSGSSGGDVWGCSSTVIKGGKFENLIEKSHIADGYELNADGYVVLVESAPNATVEIKNPMILTPDDDYMCWPNGDDSINRPLQVIMNFKAQDTYEEACASKFGKWICDFYLTFKGVDGGVFATEGCYLAGNYGSFGWIVIPADDIATELECDVAYPVVAAFDPNLTYENICDYVKDFTAAIYITPALIEANPNFEVSLELRMTNPENSDDYMVVGAPAVYDAEALIGGIQKGEDIADLESNTQIGGEIAEENINVESAKDALVEAFPELAPEQVENATIELEITVEDVVIAEDEAPSSYSYTVAPMFGIDDKQVKISELVEAITFRLPIHSKETKKAANVYHNGELMGVYEIKEENGEKFVEVSSASFSTFTVEPIEAPLPEYVVLPEGMNVSAFGDNTVTDGVNFYATLQKAVEAVAGVDGAVLYCKPGADVGTLQHAPVTNTLTIYGNGAYVSGGSDRDFDIGDTDPNGPNNGVADVAGDMTLTVKYLDGCGAWGTMTTNYTVSLVFENCGNMGKVYITGTKGTLNISITDCAFEGVIAEAIYSNANGAIEITRVDFSNLNKAINLNHKVAGTQTIVITDCTFTNCGNDVAADQIPVRVLSSVEGGSSALTVSGCTFTGTPAGGADILLDYGVGEATAEVSGTTANVTVELEKNVGTTTVLTPEKDESFTNVVPSYVVMIGETGYATLREAIAAAQAGETIALIDNIILTETVTVPAGKDVTIDLCGYSISMEESIVSTAYAIDNLGKLTLKDSKGNGSINARGIYNGYNNNSPVSTPVMIINGVNINAKGTNGGACVFNYGTLTVNSGNFTSIGGYSLNNQATGVMTVNGGDANNGIYNCGNLVINDGNINGNRSGCHVIYNWNATLTINGGSFYNYNSGNSTIMVAGTSQATINAGTFGIKDGRVPGNGNTWTSCLLDTSNSGKLTVNGGTFNGGVRVQAGTTMEITGGSFNDVTGSNFNIYGSVVISGGSFTDATAKTFAGKYLAPDYELNEDGVVVESVKAVAEVNGVKYENIQDAFKAATDGCTIYILSDIVIDYKWDARYTGSKFTTSVTIDGNGHTIKFTGIINDGYNFYSAFRFEADAVVKNLTIDMSEAKSEFQGRFRAISAKANLTVDNCKFIGNGSTNNTRAIIFGEGGTADSLANVAITITGSTFDGWRQAISDNETGKTEVKDVVITDNTMTDAGVNVSATNTITFSDNTVEGRYVKLVSYAADNKLTVTAENNVLTANGTDYNYTNASNANVQDGFELPPVAEIDGVKYSTIADALAALDGGETLKLLADVKGDLVLPADVILNGNGKQITGTLYLMGNITFNGHVKANAFDFEYTGTVINIPVGATLELNGTGRMIVGHGCIFNIEGDITDAKTADKATITPSLIIPGASFTGKGLTFNVKNAYVKVPSSYCSSSKSASGKFEFNIVNSIWESAGKFAMEAQSTSASIDFELKDSVFTTGSHLLFSVPSGEVVIDNSNVNVGSYKQFENCVNMTIKNGSVVYASVAASSNAKNPGTLTIENATFNASGEFTGSDLGIGTLVIKDGASFTAGSITKANIVIDAANMTAGVVNVNANLAKLAGSISVINNDKLVAKIVDGKLVLEAKPVAMLGDVGYATLADALQAARDAGLSDVVITLVGDTSAANAQFFDLCYATEFDSVTFKQADATKAYYIDELYTGARKYGGDFIFDGVNIIVTGQYMFEGYVKLINNSKITSTAEANCFFYYATVEIEAGSSIKGVIDDFRGGDVTVDGGRTDGQYNTEAGFEDAIMVIRWSGDSLIIKNGGYVKINSANEVGRLTIAAGAFVSVENSMLEACQWIDVAGELRINIGSLVNTKEITGNGKIIIDAAGLEGKKTLINADFSKFTGTIEIFGDEFATYEIVDNTLVVDVLTPVAEVNGQKYLTLADAIAAVEDGGIITLLCDVIIDSTTRVSSGGGWYEGVYIENDKSFTLDLGGFTLTQDGSVNDYLVFIKNIGSKASVITFKNGTIDAGTSSYCAICTSGGSTQQVTINLENVTVINNNSNGSTIKVRGGTVLNVNAGTEIIGKNSYLAIECIASTVNINDGAEIYMNGTGSYNGCLVGVGGGGVVNVYGGYGIGVKGGFIAMTSGGTINIYGGEWIANTDGSIGSNSNYYVLTAQNNSYEGGYTGASIINVYGGTIRGGMDAWILNTGRGEQAELNIFGGNFNANPERFLADGYIATLADGIYTVTEAPVKPVHIKYTNVTLTESFKISFAFALNSVENWDGYTVVITKTSLKDGSVDSVVIPTDKWKVATIGGERYIVVDYAGVAAKEMGDIITAVVYDAEGVAASEEKVDSIKDYAMRTLADSNNAELSTLIVDMLNYGAEAQIFFGYAVDDLANADLTDEQKAYASEAREYSDEAYEKVYADGYAFSAGHTLSLEYNVQLKLGMDIRALDLSDDAKIVVSYVAYNGKTVTKTVSVEGYKSGIIYVTCDTLTAMDREAQVKFELIDGENVIFTFANSVEGYTARLGAESNESDICGALMKYCDSAVAYFN